LTADQAILLSILSALLVLLVWGRWRYDIVALGALFTASLFGLVPQSELFSGFGNPATITVVLVLIVSYGLTKSGAVDYLIPLIEPASRHPILHISVLFSGGYSLDVYEQCRGSGAADAGCHPVCL